MHKPGTLPLIEARNLELHIPVYEPRDRKLMSNPSKFLADLYFARRKRKVAQLLADISFRLEPGERLGIIGANGAGKSTLLRVLAGIYPHSAGKLTVNGEIMGLFDIGFGMNGEATGLENIYLRGLQMGRNFRQIREMVPQVIEFSELEDHIDRPVDTYSSGMRMRLAFSISTLVEPDILLLDEWLGAGDARFQEKAKARMDELVEKSRGLVIATHNKGLMRSLCTKGMVLQKGRVVYYGDIEGAFAG